MSFNALTSFTVFLVGCLLVLILLSRNRKPHVWMLAISLFCFSYSCWLIFLYESRYLSDLPFFFRTSGISNYLCTPAFFIYFMIALKPRRKLQWTDLLHLIPVIIYVIDFAPILLSSNETKGNIIEELYTNPSAILFYSENWLLPEKLHWAARHIISIGYLTFMTVTLAKQRLNSNMSVRANKCVFNWLVTLTAFYTLYSAVALFTVTFFSAATGWSVMMITTFAVFTFIAFTMFLRPITLYGSLHNIVLSERNQKKHIVLTPDLASDLETRMEEFTSRQLYLKAGITLKGLADELDTQPYILSAYINKRYGMHFNDLINFHRVQYVKERLIKDQHSYTLEGIAQEAGFNNRTTFVNAFKKFTGFAPSTYAQMHRNSKDDSFVNNI